MRYQNFPFLGGKTNRFLIHDFEELAIPEFTYRHECGKFERPKGAIPESSFDYPKTILPHLPGTTFDACVDFTAYSRRSYRGKRRTHALYLAANFRQQEVLVFEKPMDDDDYKKYETVINYLKALVQGIRVTFPNAPSGSYFYQINKPIMEALYNELNAIRKRACQINRERIEDIPEFPTWSDSTLPDVYSGVYSANDWEIFAATFRQEIETFLAAMVYCGYDHLSPIVQDEEEDEPCEPFVPTLLDPKVNALLESSMTVISHHAETPNVPTPFSQPLAPSTIPSVHWADIGPEDVEDLFYNGSKEVGGLGEPGASAITADDSARQFPISELPRGPLMLEEPTEGRIQPSTQPLEPPLPIVTVVPPSENTRETIEAQRQQFAPIDQVGQINVIPDYQVQQLERVYQAPPENIEPVVPGTGTTSFNNLFKPNPYAQGEAISYATSQPESAGIGRLENVSGEFDRSALSVPNFTFNNVGQSTESHIPPMSIPPTRLPDITVPTILTRPKGYGHRRIPLPTLGPGDEPPNDDGDEPNGPNGPPRPPNGGGLPPPHPRPPGGNGPSGPPGGNGNGNGNGGRPSGRGGPIPPRGGGHPQDGGGGPPGPPDPSGGGALDPNGRPRKDIILSGANKFVKTNETHFDTKLKPDIVPTWDGNETTIIRWLTQIDELALRSASVFKGLGDIVPTRLKDAAAAWWYSLPLDHRQLVTSDWDALKREIRSYWMNQSWIEKAQIRANRARYREPSHSTETPTQYVIRKLELIKYVYNYTPSQTMSEILLKAPPMWSTVVNPRNYRDLASFQTAIKYHEELLINLGHNPKFYSPSLSQSRSYKVDTRTRSKPTRRPDYKKKSTRSYSVGWNNPKQKYPHPKDDATVSKGKTPADYGARGCLLCGSTNHWDRDCIYNKGDAVRKARTMFVDYSPEDMHAEAEYEKCYFQNQEELEDSEDEENSESPEEEPQSHLEEIPEEEQSDF